ITATAAIGALYATNPDVVFGILAVTSTTPAAQILAYRTFLSDFPLFFSGSSAAAEINQALQDGYLAPANDSALPASIAAASGATSSATLSGNNTLTFASLPSGVRPGYLVVDTTAFGAIPTNTYVVSLSGNTVTLSSSVTATVGSGDTIAF